MAMVSSQTHRKVTVISPFSILTDAALSPLSDELHDGQRTTGAACICVCAFADASFFVMGDI